MGTNKLINVLAALIPFALIFSYYRTAKKSESEESFENDQALIKKFNHKVPLVENAPQALNTEQPSPDSDGWEFGEVWKEVPADSESINMEGWSEIMTAPPPGRQANSPGAPNLPVIHQLLAEKGVQSKIMISQLSTLLTDGLFVDEKDIHEAIRIIDEISMEAPEDQEQNES